MSAGIFLVGLVIGLAIFFFGIGLCCQNNNWDILGFITMFLAICFFGSSFILSLTFPNGFEEIRNNIQGNEMIELKMQLSDKQDLSDADKATITELKDKGFSISQIYDDYTTNGRGVPMVYFRHMTLLRSKQEKKEESLANRYESISSN